MSERGWGIALNFVVYDVDFAVISLQQDRSTINLREPFTLPGSGYSRAESDENVETETTWVAFYCSFEKRNGRWLFQER